MVSFDTLKLEIPAHSVKGVDWEGWTETHKTDLKTGLTDTYRQAKNDHLPIGVSQIVYKENADFIVTISAKTLKGDYLQGISLNNWDRAVQEISPCLEIDTNLLWDANPRVLRCDTTDNVLLEKLQTTQKGVCQSLVAGKLNDRFVTKWYESKKKLGVEFHGTQQEKNRLIVYSKSLDLLKRENKDFMRSIPNPVGMIREAEKIIRVETNHTAFRSMRDRFGISDNNLQSVLNASKPVNHNFLKKVLNARDGQMSLFEQFQSMNINPIDFIYMKGIEGIIYELGCNEVSVKQFFKQLLGENFKYHYYRKTPYSIRDMVQRLKAEQKKELNGEVTGICQRLLDELLLVA